jgi:hypothetical protein
MTYLDSSLNLQILSTILTIMTQFNKKNVFHMLFTILTLKKFNYLHNIRTANYPYPEKPCKKERKLFNF